jgi:hypothetical protein
MMPILADFQFPTATAAFWASTNSPHYQVVVDNKDKNEETASFEVLTAETPNAYNGSREWKDEDTDSDDSPVPLYVLKYSLRRSRALVLAYHTRALSIQPCWTSQQLLDSLCDPDLGRFLSAYRVGGQFQEQTLRILESRRTAPTILQETT